MIHYFHALTRLSALAVLAALIAVSACGGSTAAEPVAPAEPVTLTYVTFGGLGPMEQTLIDQFEASHANLTIERRQYSQAPVRYLADTPPPDLMVIVPGEQLSSAMDQGLVTDITDIWQAADLDSKYPASFRALSEREGKQYLLPLGFAWNGIYYNKAIFEQYNLTPPHTWDEFITLCDTLLINGETPLAVSGRDLFMASLWIDYLALRLHGADFHQQLSLGEISYEDERVRAIFEAWASLARQGYFAADSRNLSRLAAAMSVVRNEKLDVSPAKAVMILGGPAMLNDLPELFRTELDYFPFPVIDPTVPQAEAVFVVGYMVPTNAPHRSEALSFLTYLSSEAARALVSKDVQANSFYVPAFAAGDPDQLPAPVQTGMALLQSADQVVTPFNLNIKQPVQFALNDALRRLLADQRTGAPFDLNAVLAALEAARQKQ